MDDNTKPDPRWNEFIEEFDSEGKLIGFKLPNNDFLFKYDFDGGWEDEKGRYYNAEGILQPDDESDSVDDMAEEDEFSDHDDDVIDEFEKILMEEEEGIVRKGSHKKTEEEVNNAKEHKKDKDVLDFKAQLDEYLAKQRLRENLPDVLFIYFKQKTDFYQKITPSIQNISGVDPKNKAIRQIKAKIEQKRKELIASNDWLNEQGVFLDFSGDSAEETYYDRYWYGVIKTSPEKYLEILKKINKSKEFKVLQIKTFYALKSKLYLKKGEGKIKETINELKGKIEPLDENKTVSLLVDGLPEQFPCSYIYDLVEYAGGRLEDVESVIVEDDTSATVTCLKRTALSLINIQGYNHDKGEFIQISFNEANDRVYAEGKHAFYFITVDSGYKIHERELHDTLAFEASKTELAKQSSLQEDKTTNIRFAVGSIAALRRVLMFRGDTLNVVRVLPSLPK